MYSALIDTVYKIAGQYGDGVLVDPRFWNLLADSYRFSLDPRLKESFKRAIDLGYVKRIFNLKGESGIVEMEISDILAQDASIVPSQQEEMTAVLFSIAIATGTLPRRSFYQYKTGQHSPNVPAPVCTRPDVSGRQPFTARQPSEVTTVNGTICAMSILGIAILWWSTYIYRYFLYEGWWMSFVVLTAGLVQVVYCSILDRWFFNNLVNKDDALSLCGYSSFATILVGFALNGAIPFFMSTSGFRSWAQAYFMQSGDSTIHEIAPPGPLSLILASVFIVCSIVYIVRCRRDCRKAQVSYSQSEYNLKVKLSAALICISGYVGLILYFPLKRQLASQIIHNAAEIVGQ